MLTRKLNQAALAATRASTNMMQQPNLAATMHQSKRPFGSAINMIDRVIKNQYENQTIKDTSFLVLLEIRVAMAAEYEAATKKNKLLTGKADAGILTAAQMKQGYADIAVLIDRNPDLKEPFEKVFSPTLYRSDGIWMGKDFNNSHSDNYKRDNVVKQQFKAAEEAIFKVKPTRDNPGELTDYGRKLQKDMGEFEFAKATQLLTNNLAEQTGTRSTTDAHICKPPGTYNSIWKDPKKAYGVEKEVQKTELSESDYQISCEESQIKLLNILRKDGVFDNFSKQEFEQALRYVMNQAEFLIDPKNLKSSAEVYEETNKDESYRFIFKKCQEELEIKVAESQGKKEFKPS